MIGTHEVITADLFDIAARVKEIDSCYFVARNYKTGKFELHAEGQKGSTLALKLPYNRLDMRTLDLARKTRRERVDALLKEMEQANAKIK